MQVQATIEAKLKEAFKPGHLEVINESHNHNVPPGSESHFRVVMVSDVFNGKPPIARHRLVNKVLADELAVKIHALALRLHTPAQWASMGERDTSTSPPCANK